MHLLPTIFDNILLNVVIDLIYNEWKGLCNLYDVLGSLFKIEQFKIKGNFEYN